jgi:hypothetical protein
MVAYSDPSKREAGISEAVAAVNKIAGMAIGAAVTLAKTVLTPESIAQIAAAGVAGPQAALGVLGLKLLDATVKLVPPATIDKTVQLAFKEVESGIADNKGLAKIATDTAYWDTIAKHGSYTSVPVGTGGQTPVELATEWIVALAHDLTVSGKPSTSSASPTTKSGPLLAAVGQSTRSASEILAAAATSTSTVPTTSPARTTSASNSSTAVATSTESASATQPGIN